MPRVLVIDSYDSFVYNLVQYLGELGAEPVVVRNDEWTVEQALASRPDLVLLSPGPGRPEDAGIICAAIPAFAEAGTPVGIITKGPMVVRDIDVLQALTARGGCTVYVSVRPSIVSWIWSEFGCAVRSSAKTASPV